MACLLYNGWALTVDETLAWLKVYNAKCEPPWSDKELAHKVKDAAKAKHEKPRGYLLDGSIADQRAEPDWTLPTKPHASGKIPTTLTTVNSNLRARAHNMDSQPIGYTQVIPRARKSENNVVNVVKMAHHLLAGPKIDQRPTDKTATDLVGQLRRFKADGSSAPATAPVEPSEMPGGVITKHDSHVAADLHSEAKARANRPYTIDPSSATGVLGVSETTDRENDVCRPSSDARGTERPNGESGIDTEVEARRIADELVKLHEAGAIKSEQDASFYANLVHLFGASFSAHVGPQVFMQGAP